MLCIFKVMISPFRLQKKTTRNKALGEFGLSTAFHMNKISTNQHERKKEKADNPVLTSRFAWTVLVS